MINLSLILYFVMLTTVIFKRNKREFFLRRKFSFYCFFLFALQRSHISSMYILASGRPEISCGFYIMVFRFVFFKINLFNQSKIH